MWILVIIVVSRCWRRPALRALSRQLPDRPEHLVLF